MTMLEIDAKIEDIISRNIKDGPHDCPEIYKYSLKQDFIEFLRNLSITDLVYIHERNNI